MQDTPPKGRGTPIFRKRDFFPVCLHGDTCDRLLLDFFHVLLNTRLRPRPPPPAAVVISAIPRSSFALMIPNNGHLQPPIPERFSSAWSCLRRAVWLRRPSVNCLTSPSPHQSLALAAQSEPSRRGREEGGGVQRGGSVKRTATSRAKPADRAIAGPPSPDTTLDHLKEPS